MLNRHTLAAGQTVDARKHALDSEAAWEMLAAADEILVAKGNGFVAFAPGTDPQEAILARALGRSGTLRAPTLKLGKRLAIGFSEGLYNHLFG